MQNNTQPIGLFDSGIGGTSIWSQINKVVPYESTIYLADSKNAPYGLKSKEEIINLCYKNTELLLNKNCKLIVVACNTATTNAIVELRSKYKVPFIGIEPAIKPAANQSQTNKIGILATKGTLNSELFYEKAKLYTHVEIFEQIGHGLVQLIESGKIDSVEMSELLQTYLTPMINNNIDYLVLGCSHYPYLIPQIKKILPKHVKIIDSGEAVARQTQKVLHKFQISNTEKKEANLIFYTNYSTDVLKSVIQNPKAIIEYLDF